MTSERSSAPRRARALPSVTALAIVFIFCGLGWLRSYAASRDNQRQTAPAAENPRSLPPSTNRPEVKLISVPLSFEPNQGQAASSVQFLSRGSGYALFLTPGKVVLNLERQQPASAASAMHTPDTLRMTLDRKSTRLNSSHLGISYAVFCLKK